MSRILWHSVAPWAPSGYGQQTKVFAPRIRDLGHHVAISAYWGLEGSVLNWGGMSVYPADERVWQPVPVPLGEPGEPGPRHHAHGRLGPRRQEAHRPAVGVLGARRP